MGSPSCCRFLYVRACHDSRQKLIGKVRNGKEYAIGENNALKTRRMHFVGDIGIHTPIAQRTTHNKHYITELNVCEHMRSITHLYQLQTARELGGSEGGVDWRELFGANRPRGCSSCGPGMVFKFHVELVMPRKKVKPREKLSY